jgi:hypothetical protein
VAAEREAALAAVPRAQVGRARPATHQVVAGITRLHRQLRSSSLHPFLVLTGARDVATQLPHMASSQWAAADRDAASVAFAWGVIA